MFIGDPLTLLGLDWKLHNIAHYHLLRQPRQVCIATAQQVKWVCGLQAMDRAHRLGQKRTVNVYRLLTRDSLEDKIMGLQRFKLDVANSVVNQDNVSLKSMDAGRLLDLFSLDNKEGTVDAGGEICRHHSFAFVWLVVRRSLMEI